MKFKLCKITLAISVFMLLVLSGCSQQASMKVEIATNDQGLPETEELLRKSSEQVNLLESYRVNIEANYLNHGNTQDGGVWEGLFSTEAIQYTKTPFLLYSETNYQENNKTVKQFVADEYGLLENDGERWERVLQKERKLPESLKEEWQLIVDPYAELKDLDDLTMTTGQEQDQYILHVTGSKHDQSFHEGHYDTNGKEYTLVITTDLKYKLRYLISKDTLLPTQKIQEIEQVIDYSGKTTYFDKTISFTYGDYNHIKTSRLSNAAKKISKSLNKNEQ